MTGLLVSVRDAEEARAALRGGADIIDVKEPRRGSLGAADPRVWREVRAAVSGRTPVSAALGELQMADVTSLARHLAGFQFVKLGLAGCGDDPHWPALWKRTIANIPPSSTVVAVAYADWQRAAAPPPGEVLNHAIALRCGALLFDTFDKTRGDLFCHLPDEELAALARRSRAHGLRVVVAGSLTHRSLTAALRLSPEWVAVRGAVCRGERTASVDESLVAHLRARLTATRVCVAR